MPDSRPVPSNSVGHAGKPPRFRRLILPGLWWLFAVAAVLFLTAPAALAQYYGAQPSPGYGFNPSRNPFQPDAETLFGVRLAVIGGGAVFGFIVGAFFSPAFRTFRRFLFLALLVGSVAFALFGPWPLADTFSYLVAFVVGLVAFAIGIQLGVKALRAAWRQPTSYGKPEDTCEKLSQGRSVPESALSRKAYLCGHK